MKALNTSSQYPRSFSFKGFDLAHIMVNSQPTFTHTHTMIHDCRQAADFYTKISHNFFELQCENFEQISAYRLTTRPHNLHLHMVDWWDSSYFLSVTLALHCYLGRTDRWEPLKALTWVGDYSKNF